MALSFERASVLKGGEHDRINADTLQLFQAWVIMMINDVMHHDGLWVAARKAQGNAPCMMQMRL
jgi:hypothetical protein